MTDKNSLGMVLNDSAYIRLRRQRARIKWCMSLLAIFAGGSYCWLTGYAGAWFSKPMQAGGVVSIGLVWMAGSIIVLVLSEVLYEWYCRKNLDPLRAVLTERYFEVDEAVSGEARDD